MAEAKRSLYDDLTAPRTISSSQCKLHIIMSDMDEKDAEAIARAVDLIRTDRGTGRSKAYSSSWLAGILRSHGHRISTSTVQRHVQKVCPCE